MSSRRPIRVVVVGAGLGGLSAAAHLRGAGHDVTVVERGPRPGGRAGLVEAEGFRLDNGPTVLTMPGFVDDVFAAVGADRADHLAIDPVDPMYRAVYDDGSVLHVRHGRDAMRAEIARFAGGAEAAGFDRFCSWLEHLYRAELDAFIDTNFDSPFDLLKPWRSALALTRLGGFGRLDRRVARYFADERLRRIFSFQSLYAGLAPHDALALYAVITYMDSVEGVYAPRGGMHALATSLTSALSDAGVSFRFDSEVTAISRSPAGRVDGVVVGDDRLDADAVVCNADLPVAYRSLLDIDAPRRVRRAVYSPSCLLWVAGVRGEPPAGAAHHNIHFGRAWATAFDEVISGGRMMTDPSILVTLHSLDDPSLAPEGCSTLYALEPAPNLGGTVDWARDRQRLQDSLRARVTSLGYPSDVIVERWYDPTDWERLGMACGTPFAMAHTFAQTGPFRARNTDRRVPGLVFVGSSTVPGVGVPMVLLSGRLAAERVAEHADGAR